MIHQNLNLLIKTLLLEQQQQQQQQEQQEQQQQQQQQQELFNEFWKKYDTCRQLASLEILYDFYLGLSSEDYKKNCFFCCYKRLQKITLN